MRTVFVILMLAALAAALAIGIAWAVPGAEKPQGAGAHLSTGPAEADVIPPQVAIAEGATRLDVAKPCEVIVCREGGQPIAGALVREGDRDLGSTDGAGVCRFDAFDVRPRTVVAAHPGFFSSEASVSPGGARALITLEAKYEFRVTVTDAQGLPLPAVKLSLESVSGTQKQSIPIAETRADTGIALFESVPKGSYYVKVASRDLYPREMALERPNPLAPQPPGQCKIPDDTGMTITVTPPAIACVQVDGDEVVRHWFATRHSPTLMAAGLVPALKAIRAGIVARYPEALAVVWMPSEPVEHVVLNVFLRHGGWQAFRVPVVSSPAQTTPHLLKIPGGGDDQTGTISVVSEEHLGIPLVATLSGADHGIVEVPIGSGEGKRVPLGQYSIAAASAARGASSYLVITPGTLSLSSQSPNAQVRLSSTLPLRELDCVVEFAYDGLAEPKLLRGTVDIMQGGELLQMAACSGRREELNHVWLPMGVDIVWRMQMLIQGQVRTLECSTIVTGKTESPMVVVLK